MSKIKALEGRRTLRPFVGTRPEWYQRRAAARRVIRAWVRGYVSRRWTENERYEYDGRYGRGVVDVSPSYLSTRYCHITYYIEEVK